MSKKIFFLDEMLTPKIITFVYWLMLLSIAFNGLNIIFKFGFTFEKFILGSLTILGGIVGARILCELLIVIFKIHENLKKIADTEKDDDTEKDN